jgi:hypothetical protein
MVHCHQHATYGCGSRPICGVAKHTIHWIHCISFNWSPSPIPIPYCEKRKGKVCPDTPHPSIKLKRESLHELVPIEVVAGSSQEECEMEEGSVMKVREKSLIVLEYKEAFHNEGLEFIYNWVDDEGEWYNEYDEMCHHGISFSTFQSNSPCSLHSSFLFLLTIT